MRGLISASGGLVWHARALRYRHHWISLQNAVRDWIVEWSPDCDGLILVGPSAGWTLPSTTLREWGNVLASDPDPLARWWLARRLSPTPVQWIDENLLSAEAIHGWRQHHPRHAWLFCNVLGQVLPADADAAARQVKAWRDALDGAPWASYHDLVSCTAAPAILARQRHAADCDLDERILAHWKTPHLSVTDHQTSRLARGLTTQTLPWLLRPGHWHLVEWCASQGCRAASTNNV